MAYRILSINGGGIHGAASARFLSRLEADHGHCLYEVFDYFAGTSTGALIALHMAVNKASAAQCYSLYNAKNAREIFDASPWDRLIPVYVSNGNLAQLEKLGDDWYMEFGADALRLLA